ncbi:hypothetical protein AK830_g4348 [Neonectria ditissima]|uniref:Amidohydrolase 3 domain-containing protein n=1 Tax=Neonectria ditissima TaxID=78410 RepID=A0A0P7BP45_9HYPO|nr:hypothetical protein AK830_g4348 [Neonectria ditissima]
MRIAAYWLIRPAEDEAARVSQVERAIELSRRFNIRSTPKLRIVGIKVIIDGVTESCTEYLSEPYANSQLPQPIWSEEELEPVVRKAVAGGLQIAFHAIGDAAVSLAIRSLEWSSKPGGRHRIEHLEVTSPDDAEKLARLGITASFQPIHADPYLLQHWPRLLDAKRAARCYAWREFADAGALIALGTDSPVTPWNPLNNLHVATTRRSVQDALMPPVNEHFRLGLCEAVVGATAGSAKSVFADHLTGSLELGKSADLVILDMNWDGGSLLKAEIQETWFEGRMIWCKDSDIGHGR